MSCQLNLLSQISDPEICLHYLRHGIYTLQPLWESYYICSLWIWAPVYFMWPRFLQNRYKHGCSGYLIQIIQKSTGTFTGVKTIEFQTFQKNRSKFCNPVQMPVHTQLGKTNLAKSLRNTNCLKPPLPRKKKKCHELPPSAGPARAILPLMDLEIPVPTPSVDSLKIQWLRPVIQRLHSLMLYPCNQLRLKPQKLMCLF